MATAVWSCTKPSSFLRRLSLLIYNIRRHRRMYLLFLMLSSFRLLHSETECKESSECVEMCFTWHFYAIWNLFIHVHGWLQGGLGQIAAGLVTDLWHVESKQSARQFYQKILKSTPPGGDFFHMVLTLETADNEQDRLRNHELIAIFEVKLHLSHNDWH